MKRLILLAVLLAGGFSGIRAQEHSGEFRHARLKNGLTYYIRQTKAQPGTADFYLVQNVGALMEEDHQNGLAHVLEHMAFHATASFPDGVPAFLQRHGISAFNAVTRYDETIYNINNVPVVSQEVVDSCLLVLRDWSGFLTLKEEDMDRERKVIREERRMRMTLAKRIQGMAEPYLYNHSKYATHNIIGTVEVVRDFTPGQLRDYYKDFYRPDQQAVIVLGDIDAEKIEAEVKRLFAPIPKRTNPKPRLTYEIEDNPEPLYARLIDKDIAGHSMMLSKRKRNPRIDSRESMIREIVLRDLYNDIMGGFLSEYVEAGESYILTAGVSLYDMVRNYDNLTLMLNAVPGKEKEALRQLLDFVSQVHRHGFTDEILRPVFENYQHSIREGLKRDELSMPKNLFLQIYQDNFLLKHPLCSIREKLETTLSVVDTLSAQTFRSWISGWYDNDDNWVFLMQGNDASYPFPDAGEILDMIRASRTAETELPGQSAIAEEELERPVDFELPEGKIVKSKPMKDLGAEEWTLSNGAKVYYKYVDGTRGVFSLLAQSEGGRSLLAAEDLPSADALSALTLQSGIHKLDARTLKLLVNVHPMDLKFLLDEKTENMQLTGNVRDIDLAFQLFYLAVERPRFDSIRFERFLALSRLSESNSRPTVNDTIRDALTSVRRIESPRLWKKDSAYYAAMDYGRMVEIFRERFQDASDFTFYLVGDVDREEARRLSARYLGALSSAHRQEKSVHHVYDREGDITQDIEVGLPDRKYMVSIEYRNDLKTTPSEELCMRILQTYLQYRLTDKIRGNESAAYAVQVQGEATTVPYRQELFVRFATDLDRGPRMRAVVHEQIRQLLQEGISDEEVEDLVLFLKKEEQAGRDAAYNSIDFWTENLRYFHATGKRIDDPRFFDKIISKIKGKDVHAFARRFFADAECVDLVIKSKPEMND